MNFFIKGFIYGLRNLAQEYPDSKIMFKGINGLFEDLTRENIFPSNSKYEKSSHICFGNTVGNFDQEEIFGIFNDNMLKGDLLLLGIQLAFDPDRVLRQYESNKRFEKLLVNSISKKLEIKKIDWKWNSEEGQIEAWAGDILVFRSKKYDEEEFENFVEKHSFLIVKKFVERDVALYVMKKE